MEPNPTYQGQLHHPGQAPAPQVQQGTPELDALMSRNERAMLAHGIELDNELVNAHDFALQQERVARTKRVTDAFQAEMQEIAARPYGDPKSLFDKNGRFREAYFNERRAHYASMLRGTDGGFLGADAKAKATAAMNQTFEAMDIYANSVVKASLKQHGVTQFEGNYYDALANGQYNLALDLITQASQSKIINAQAAAGYRGKLYAANASHRATMSDGRRKVLNSLPSVDD